MKYDHIMVRFGELSTKGKNKNDFIKMLAKNITNAVSDFNGLEIITRFDHIYVKLNDNDPLRVIEVMQDVSGIQGLSLVLKTEKEIENLEDRIITFGVGVSSVKIKELNVDSSPRYESIQEKVAELKDLWIQKRVEALEEYIKIEHYISNIEDSEIRQIMRYRYLDLKKWDDIDVLLCNGTNYSKKKYYKYIKTYPTLSH